MCFYFQPVWIPVHLEVSRTNTILPQVLQVAILGSNHVASSKDQSTMNPAEVTLVLWIRDWKM